MKTFEEYMKEVHMLENPEILDDDLPDTYNEWLTEIQPDDWLKYGNEYSEIKKHD